jgi:hypothetical protein
MLLAQSPTRIWSRLRKPDSPFGNPIASDVCSKGVTNGAASFGQHARTLDAWQLATLRFAVTLDNADRLGVLAIANEIDRLGRQNEQASNFGFFRRNAVDGRAIAKAVRVQVRKRGRSEQA